MERRTPPGEQAGTLSDTLASETTEDRTVADAEHPSTKPATPPPDGAPSETMAAGALPKSALPETMAAGMALRAPGGADPGSKGTAQTAETRELASYGLATGELLAESVQADSLLPSMDEAERYERGPLLGRGGMGEVALQLDRRIGRHVAQKTLREDISSQHAFARFVREVRVQGQLEHPAVVPVYDFGVTGAGLPFFTMKRVRGQTLHAILEHLGARDPETVARYSRRKVLAAFAQVCLAVEYAHTRGVIHRDLKPGNVMLGDFGEVYVLDWGLAKLVTDGASQDFEGKPAGDAAGVEMTRAGDVVGTPRYMAPEQCVAQKGAALDARADVFALGAMLFEILTLQSYRRADSLAKLLVEARRSEVERPSERTADVPPELDEICALALAPDPARRLPSAHAIADAVERYLEGERDLKERKALAARLVASARARLEEGSRGEASARTSAMREAMKAIAVAPEDPDAQRLLLSMVVDSSGELPPAAEREFEEQEAEQRAHGLRMAMAGYVSWLCLLPLALWIGVRNWPIPTALSGLTLFCLGFSWVLHRRGARDRRAAPVLAALTASILALSTGWLGPFVLAPLAACGTAVMFVIHSGRAERRTIVSIYALGIALPFLVEWLGLVPPAYTFRDGDLVLHARLLELPPGLTIAALAYTAISFPVLLNLIVGRMRDRQREAERRLFAQAWHLRQLFPAEGGSGTASRAGAAPAFS